MKSTTRTIASGMLVLSLIQTTLATARGGGTDGIEAQSPEMVQALETDGVLSSHDLQRVTNVNDVVGGQGQDKVLPCGLCILGSAVALVVAPPVGFLSALGCIMLCAEAF